MFEDEFKKANDSIHAGDELLEKVMRLKNKKKITPYRYVSAAAAAAVVISASAYALPRLMNKNTEHRQSRNEKAKDKCFRRTESNSAADTESNANSEKKHTGKNGGKKRCRCKSKK